MSRVWLRAAALALVVAGTIAGLTIYFSTETVPRCLVSGAGTWRAPKDGKKHRYEVVVLKDDACFFDMDRKQKLVGALSLEQAGWLLAALPPRSDTLHVTDQQHRVVYETRRGLLGFRVLSLQTGRPLYVVHYVGFTWNPRFGPDPPSHGLSLAPDRPELWALDAPNSVLHLFDVSALPGAAPVRLEDIRLSKPISGDESPCASPLFHRPRLEGLRTLSSRAAMDGVAYTKLTLDLRGRFDSHFESFALDGTSAAAQRINAALGQGLAGDPPSWFGRRRDGETAYLAAAFGPG